MSKQYEYSIKKSREDLTSVCESWNAAYNMGRGHMEYTVPETAGNGRLICSCHNRNIRVVDYQVNFKEPVEIQGVSKTPHLDMLFCLGEDTSWELPESGRKFELLTGESYMGVSFETRKRSIYPAGRDIHIFEVKVPLPEIQDVMDTISESLGIRKQPAECFPWGKHKLTPAAGAVLQQIRNCSYPFPLQQLYTEGKLMELAAICLSETVYHTEKTAFLSKISSGDLKDIHAAKKILDDNIADAPSLEALSAAVGLNDFKLKKGFKEVFGVPIHTYVIQKRLELAKNYLEGGEMTVSEAAGSVGYGNISHFAAAFHKQYGTNPGAYLRDIKGKSGYFI